MADIETTEFWWMGRFRIAQCVFRVIVRKALGVATRFLKGEHQMAKGRLFEYAILFHPNATKDEADRGVEPKSKVLAEPKTVLADSPEQVGILAARSIDDGYLDKLDQVEIVVRPF